MKDRLVKNLLNLGKKHRILVYPTLAIVAIITAFSHMVYWGRGNGKKVVASVMIMTMLITQSIFLTSSANVADGTDISAGEVASPTDGVIADGDEIQTDDPNLQVQPFGLDASANGAAPIADPVAPTFYLYRVDENGTAYPVAIQTTIVYTEQDSDITITMPGTEDVKLWAFGSENASYFDVLGISMDQSCSPTISGSTTLTKTSDNTYNLYFKATRKVYPVTIKGDGLHMNDKTIEVPVTATSGDINPQFSFNVGTAAEYSAYTYGRTYAGLIYDGVTYSVGNPITITPSDESVMGFTVDTAWEGMEFVVTYKAKADTDTHITVDGSETKTVTYKYGTPVSLWSETSDNMKDWAEHDGYYLSGWNDGTQTHAIGGPHDSSKFAINTGAVTDTNNITGATLTAVWTYKEIQLQTSGTGASVDGNGGVLISGSYGDTIDCSINAIYSKDSSVGEKFEYNISDDDKTMLAGYGLNVAEIRDAGGVVTSYKITGKLTNVTDAAGKAATLTITDNNKLKDITSTHVITLVSNPRQVSIDTSDVLNEHQDSTPRKTYDGVATIPVYAQANVLDAVAGDDVYVTFDNKAILDSANVGKNKPITLTNVVLSGAKADMYVLKDVGTDKQYTILDIAQVDPKSVDVTVSLAEGQDDEVFFGEASPSYVLEADSSMLTPADAATYNGLSTPAEKEAFMRAHFGFNGFETSRSLYSPEGEYFSSPIFAGTGFNYAASSTNLKQKFTVVRDDSDGYYVEVGTPDPPVGEYYKKYTITPANGYDKIRLIGAGEGDISPDMSKNQAEALFKNDITLDTDMTNGSVTFQMLNSSTGAITYSTKISGINIDTSGPVLVDYEVSPNISYFNQFGFGAYYHSQNIEGTYVESVSITFEYTSNDSKCESIKYYFADEAGELKQDFSGSIAAVKDATTGNYKGTLTIGTGASGQLIVYAEDATGNTSTLSKVKIDEVIDFVKSAENSSNYYEWMVENIISPSDIVVTKLSGDSVGTEIWNNGIVANVTAADQDSGVWKLEWYITDPSGNQTTVVESADKANTVYATKYGKVTQYDFGYTLSGESLAPGKYSIGATLYDNAGNNVALMEQGPYFIDTLAPRITTGEYAGIIDGYVSGVELEFGVTEPEDESGVASVKLYLDTEDDEGILGSWGDDETFNYSVVKNGTYIIVATDVAGNVSRESITFNKISNVIPNAPIIKVDGTVGKNNWYVEEVPTITITNQKLTADGVPVTTVYRVTSGGMVSETETRENEIKFDVTYKGDVKIEAWSKSDSGCESTTTTLELKVDTEAPNANITEATVNNDGKPVINFKAYDAVSGVNADEVYVNGKKIEVLNDNGFISGSFVVEDSATYTITVEDMAGNVSDELEFVPLSIETGAITNILPDGACINANIIQGTSPIAEARIEYKPATENEYDVCLANKNEEPYGLSLNYQFRNLMPDTVYDYKIYATTHDTKEVKVVEGSFRTADADSTATVKGAVYYDEDLVEGYKTYPIYVALYEANTVVAGVNLEGPEDVKYEFENVPNGTYRVVATNGMLTEVTTVTVSNGGILYPDDYASNGGVNLVLDGYNTNVVIKDGAINIAADGLEKIYNTALYNGNVTDEDLEVAAQGGTIDITLYANYIDVSDLNQSIQTIFGDKIGKNGVVQRYIELNVVKEVRDEKGVLVNGTPMNITRLAEPITVSFPLGDLSGQQVYVASLHGNDSNYKFENWGPDGNITILDESVVISTERFSVYALYTLVEPVKEYTVKWIDGDGNIMKSEVVKDGNAATPPANIPTKKETSKYVYTFSGWDTDYSSIKKDTIISAWFTAKEKVTSPSDKPTTENPVDKPSNNKPTTSEPVDEDISKEPVTYPYMGSGISPQTGDEAPIVAMTVMMLLAGAGMVVLGFKKKKEN